MREIYLISLCIIEKSLAYYILNMDDITIRPANAHDLVTLNQMMFDLHDEHHHQCPEYFKSASDIEEIKSIARYLDDPECLVFVACHSDKILGFVTGHFCELISSVSKPVQMGSIDELFIEQESRRFGVARKLCMHMEQTFLDYGVIEVFVEVWDFNKNALGFYTKSGFSNHIHWLRKKLVSN